jgi:hypothetical protein
VNLKNLVVFHLDECLDWQGRELPRNHPYSFRGFMKKFFCAPVEPFLAVLPENRNWLNANNVEEIKKKNWAALIDITYGGWGQDGKDLRHLPAFPTQMVSTAGAGDAFLAGMIPGWQRTYPSLMRRSLALWWPLSP